MSAPTFFRRAAAGLFAAAALAGAQAQTSDLDALALEPEVTPAPQPPQAAPRPWRLFAEGALGQARLRSGGHDTIGRLSLDGQADVKLGPQARAVVSARLDALEPEEARYAQRAVFSLREIFASWQAGDARTVVDAGRVNVRHGQGYGYNPTDFLRDGTLRTVTTLNPFSLRENRLGVFMVRGQRLWDGGSASLLVAPKLADGPADRGLSADVGATNQRQRALGSLNVAWSETANSQFIVYDESDASPSLGINGTALFGSAFVAHAEFAWTRAPSLLAAAGQAAPQRRSGSRVALGGTYTTEGKLSLTAELHYNAFALSRGEWDGLRANAAAALAPYHLTAQLRQDSAARQAAFFYATQKDLGVRNLDLTALANFNRTDGSRLFWAELRYRMERFDVAVQWLESRGQPGSAYGVVPVSRSLGVLGAAYF